MLFGLLTMVVPAHADFVAYTDPSGAGNQTFMGNLALNFTVNSPITVTELGVFNALGDGVIHGLIQVEIFNTDTSTPVTPGLTFHGVYTPVGNDVFQKLVAPVVLGPGNYQVDAVGFGASDPNGNISIPGSTGPMTNSGDGVLMFTGAAWNYTSGSFQIPNTCGSCTTAPSPQNQQFDAGTFEYKSMDEASVVTELTLTMGLAGLGLVWARKRRNHQASQA